MYEANNTSKPITNSGISELDDFHLFKASNTRLIAPMRKKKRHFIPVRVSSWPIGWSLTPLQDDIETYSNSSLSKTYPIITSNSFYTW